MGFAAHGRDGHGKANPMIRLILSVAIFGGIAVAALLYFDLIELTPEGESALDEAERVIEEAVDAITSD
jgi:hypothetical protein